MENELIYHALDIINDITNSFWIAATSLAALEFAIIRFIVLNNKAKTLIKAWKYLLGIAGICLAASIISGLLVKLGEAGYLAHAIQSIEHKQTAGPDLQSNQIPITDAKQKIKTKYDYKISTYLLILQQCNCIQLSTLIASLICISIFSIFNIKLILSSTS